MHKVVRPVAHGRLVTMAMVVLAASGIGRAAQAQTRITGRVVDPDHAPIPAAQVLVTGTTVGTNTSDSGRFTLQVPADGRSLTIRRIGFLGQTVPITAGQTDYTITLTRDVLRLEAQVVTGVATTVSSKSSANDVAVVNTQAVNEVPAPTIENCHSGARARRAHLAEQRRRAGRRDADPDPRHHLDQRQCVAALRDRRRDHRQRHPGQPGNNAITFSTAWRGPAGPDGPRHEPDRRLQPGGHRVDRGPEGRVGLGDLRIEGLGWRDHHHDQAGEGGQAAVELLAEGRALLGRRTRRHPPIPDVWRARRRGTTTTSIRATGGHALAANNAFISEHLRGNSGLSGRSSSAATKRPTKRT